MTDIRPARRHHARLIMIWLTLMLAIGVAPARAAGTTWLVDRPGDDVNSGDMATHKGSIRFALAHAVSGDLVVFGDIGVDTIFLSSQGGTLVVPPGVAVGRRRDQADCGSYNSPQITIQDPSLSPVGAIDPIMSLGAGATLRNVTLMFGRISLRITGPNVEVCGVGLGRTVDGDGVVLPGPPWSSALIVDGDHAAIRRSYINGGIVVTTHGSDTRLGDMLDGSGDENAGVRDAYVTVLADQAGAARRVTIRDPFPRALHDMPGNGVAGGDDLPNHANNWAMTPEIISAYSYDDFATVQIHGIASPNSLVDIFFDNQITVARQVPVLADATGKFSFTGALPPVPPPVLAIAASTLADAAHPGRVGSSSQWSSPKLVTLSSATPLAITPAALTFTAILTGTPPPDQYLAVTAPSDKPNLAWQTAVSTTDGLSWLGATPASGSGSGTLTVHIDPAGLQPGVYHGTVAVFDPAQPATRADAAITLLALSGEPLLGALGGVVDLSGAPAGPAHPGDTLRFIVTMTNLGAVALTNINSTNPLLPQGYPVVSNSGVVSGGAGFVATDQGFSGGTLAPGTSATYALDVQVPAGALAGMAIFSLEANANGTISVPVVGRMRIAPPAPSPQPVVWLPVVIREAP
jgi:uncharacterized repeat protein (TIGR01451 family)